MPTIAYISTNLQDNTVTFAYGHIRYEYFLPSTRAVSDIDYIARISTLKAFNRAKRIAMRVEKQS